MQREPGILTLHRREHGFELPFDAAAAGEAVLHLEVGAPDADWSLEHRACAVIDIAVDAARPSQLVVPTSDPVTRAVLLGHVSAGQHIVAITLAKSTAIGVHSFAVRSARVEVSRRQTHVRR